MQEPPSLVDRSGAPAARRAAITTVLAVMIILATGTSQATPPPASTPSPGPEPWAYTPGAGLRVGDTPLTLGGYVSTNIERPEGGPAVFTLDDLSGFVIFDPHPHLHLFSELEVEDALNVDDHGRTGVIDERFTVERLYGDVRIADELIVRGGVFLTPIGRWNLIHAAPLVWTTSRPLVTEKPFDPRSTGVLVFGSTFPGDAELTYSVFGQFTGPIEGNPGFEPADDGAGTRLEYTSSGGWSLGSSYMATNRDGDWRHLTGLDLLWRTGPLELMGEFAFDDGPGGRAQWGLYLQTAVEVIRRLHLVGRYEHFTPRTRAPDVNLVVLGLAYKPLATLILKTEYLIADHRAAGADPGFKASIAVLF